MYFTSAKIYDATFPVKLPFSNTKYDNAPYHILGDDDSGIPMMGVIRSVEEALREYDIDTRTCLARTMCNQYQTKLEEEKRSTAARISRGILDNLAGYVVF